MCGFCAYGHAQNIAFSVSKDTKVIFSKGNVQYHPKKNLWRFSPNQYDMIGEKNAKVSSSYNGWMDLFGWGTGAQPCLATNNYKDYREFVDWGVKFSNEGMNWRTLTCEEWKYLFLKRENANKLLGIGIVAGVVGVFILPDDANLSNKEFDFISLADQDVDSKWESYCFSNEPILNMYTEKQWDLLQSKGVVFLPYAGRRNTKILEQICEVGYYWTSEEDYTTPFGCYAISLSTTILELNQPIYRQFACAVRLVSDIK